MSDDITIAIPATEQGTISNLGLDPRMIAGDIEKWKTPTSMRLLKMMLFRDVELLKIMLEGHGKQKRLFTVDSKTADGDYPLHIAVRMNSEKAIDVIVDAGADLEAKSGRDFTALHIASALGLRGCLSRLLSFGADLSARNESMETPLDLAIKYGHKDCVGLIEAAMLARAIGRVAMELPANATARL